MEMQPSPRMIQNLSEATSLVYHWGYGSRAVPCTNDAGTCTYLDVIYNAHDAGILYSGILWCTIAGIFFVWAIGRRLWSSRQADELFKVDNEKAIADTSRTSRLKRTIAAQSRSHLLPDAIRSIFGRTTRLQVLILAALAGYILIWTMVGIVYGIWITPVKASPGLYNTRSSLGAISDRLGVLAYALTPLSVLLSSRESILSLLTGVPYQSFNFLHRWLGYIIVVQGAVHTIGWTVIEARLYQPQPTTGIAWITQTYMIWGIVAMTLLLLIFGFSTPWGIRTTGYEFFRKAHYVLAAMYIGACWAHWDLLGCFLWPAFAVWVLDRAIRLARTSLMHYQYLPDGSMGFKAVPATLTHFPDAQHGDIVRMDFTHNQDAWKIGQHFYLCFAECSIWQSHPFTPLNLPEVRDDGVVAHSYILRAKKGETKKVADLTLKKLAANPKATTPLILSGSYGESIVDTLTPDVNVLCVAGGTGITYVLPVLLGLIQQPKPRDRKVELIWMIRRKEDIRWVKPELDSITKASKSHGVTVHIYVTRESSAAPIPRDAKVASDPAIKELESSFSSSASSSMRGAHTSSFLDVQRIAEDNHSIHPDLKEGVNRFVENTIRGRTVVYASGPGGMISDLRTIVAGCNSASKVWKGNERYDVALTCDDRLEW